jgi:hypothetical protein
MAVAWPGGWLGGWERERPGVERPRRMNSRLARRNIACVRLGTGALHLDAGKSIWRGRVLIAGL